MRQRVLILGLSLILRCVLGWATTLRQEINKPVLITGNVDKIYQSGSECILSVGKILIGSGKICAAKPGDKVRVFGSFERRVIDSFEGRLWLVSKQIERLERTQEIENSRTQDGSWVNNFRERLVLIYKKFVPEPEAGLVAGVVLGYKKDIGQEFYEQMVRSGSIHIAVASGYNILLVGGAVLAFGFWWLRRAQTVWVAFLAMIFYAVLAGGEPPVVRAVWMAGLMYLGQVLGRGSVSSWVWLLTAWAMLMIAPTLIASASFQLSVAASFGLMVIEPEWSRRMEVAWGDSWTGLARSTGVMSTLSTMIVTMPIIWWHFARMSLFGIVSNILILPLVPPLMILGVGTLVLPRFLAWPTYALAHWMVLVINFFGS